MKKKLYILQIFSNFVIEINKEAIRNYAKQTDGRFARIIGKISALTVAQYINYLNNQPIGRVKYALV